MFVKVMKLGFGVVIGRYGNGSDRRQIFVTMSCERSGTYQPSIRKLKRDDTRSRKCERQFKSHEYHKANDTWKFNVISGIHNHTLCQKLADHPVVCCLIMEENELFSDMTFNMVVPKNMLATLKRKNLQNI